MRVTIAKFPLFRKKMLAQFAWEEGSPPPHLHRAAWARRRRSHAVFAVPHEALARLAVQVLRVGLLGAFDRLGGTDGGVLGAGARGRRRSIGRRVKGVRGAAEEDAKRRSARQSVDPHLKKYPVAGSLAPGDAL